MLQDISMGKLRDAVDKTFLPNMTGAITRRGGHTYERAKTTLNYLSVFALGVNPRGGGYVGVKDFTEICGCIPGIRLPPGTNFDEFVNNLGDWGLAELSKDRMKIRSL